MASAAKRTKLVSHLDAATGLMVTEEVDGEESSDDDAPEDWPSSDSVEESEPDEPNPDPEPTPRSSNHHPCDKCESVFSTYKQLKVHAAKHKKEKVYQCAICNKRFAYKMALKKHIRTHTGDEEYECPVCDKKYSRMGNLNAHMRVHSDVAPYSCSVCGKSFAELSDLVSHQEVHTDEQCYDCEDCGRQFLSAGELKAHISNMHAKKTKKSREATSRKKPYKCKYCKKTFTTVTATRKHMKIHNRQTHECQECKAQFERKDHLTRHMVTHSGERPFQCYKCGLKFALKSDLKKHMAMHQGSKAYQCQQCEQSFTRMSSYLLHMKNHTGEKPYQCTFCQKYFGRVGYLETHLKTHESVAHCNSCGEILSDRRNFLQHMLDHTTLRHYQCGLCNLVFARNEDLENHFKSHTAEMEERMKKEESFMEEFGKKIQGREHMCSVCGLLLRDRHGYMMHMATHEEDGKLSDLGARSEAGSTPPRSGSDHSSNPSPGILSLATHRDPSISPGTSGLPSPNLDSILAPPVPPFRCPVCRQVFVCQEYLSVHMVSHTGSMSHAGSVDHSEEGEVIPDR